MRFFSFLIFFIFLHGALFAQSDKEAKAEKLFFNAQSFIKKNRDDKAEKELLKAIDESPQYSPAYAELGNLYCRQQQFSKAADIFKQAEKSCKNCANAFALPLATMLCNAQQYAQAEAVLASWSFPNLKNEKIPELSRLKANIQFGKYASTHTWDTAPVNLGLRINSEYDEYFPTASPDDSTLYFTRRTGGVDEDFYIAGRDSCDDGAWLSARDMGSPPNSSHQEGAQYISADGHYMFFMQCDNRSDNGWEAGGCDLYFSYTDSTGWSQPVPFGYTINTTAFEGMPSLSSDNKEMFFVSDRPGGYGGKDIWVAKFEDGLWQIPQNLGPDINTPFDETAPYIAADNKTLYFTSDGLPGMGGNDIYMAKRNPNGTWQAPVNIGYPFNTAYNEVSFCITADGRKGYMASDRPGGFGKMDLYEIALPEALRPEKYTYVVGKVYDSITKERVPYAQLEWNDTTIGVNIYQFQANKGDATYMSAIAVGKPFAISVHRGGYRDYNDTLIFNQENIVHPDTLDFALLPYDYDLDQQSEMKDTIASDSLLFTFYFREKDTTLTQFYQQQLVSFVQSHLQDSVTYWINGYADDGSNTIINEQMANGRAVTVAHFMEWSGIDKANIHVQGWGDANPIAPHDTEEQRNLNRRAEVIIRRPQ